MTKKKALPKRLFRHWRL